MLRFHQLPHPGWGATLAYSIKLEVAARRHLAAAEKLYTEPHSAGTENGNTAVAGYLFGLAGEMALKKIMADAGIRCVDGNRREDPYYSHFPELIRLSRLAATGRRGSSVLLAIQDPALFGNWDIQMRYAPTSDIRPDWVVRWREHARRLVGRMES